MGGKQSLLPAGFLGPSGVPTLLGHLELMAGSLTCGGNAKPQFRDTSVAGAGGAGSSQRPPSEQGGVWGT